MNKSDLEERTSRFSECILDYIKTNAIGLDRNISAQLLKSACSIGANYCEAQEAESRKDFIHKVSIAKKEIRETKYWLRLLTGTMGGTDEKIINLRRECHELMLIFSKIVKTAKQNSE